MFFQQPQEKSRPNLQLHTRPQESMAIYCSYTNFVVEFNMLFRIRNAITRNQVLILKNIQ